MKKNSWPNSLREKQTDFLPNHITERLSLWLIVLVLTVFALLVLIPRLSFAQSTCAGYTLTQGAYGSGNGAGAAALANFNGSVTIGCSGGNSLTLNSVAAIVDFLPSGSTPSVLDQSYVDPGAAYSNVLAGQLVTLVLNIAFDTSHNLGAQTITTGTYSGKTIVQFVQIVNNVIGGCSTGVDLTELNSIATLINENYDNGTVNNGFVTCCNVNALAVITPPLCYGGPASVIVTATGGTGVYTGTGTYSLNDGSSATYTVIDGNGCTATTNAVTAVCPPQLVASATAGTILCHGGSTTVTISAVGGSGSYSGTGTFTVTAGTYNYIVTDGNGCTATASVKVTEPCVLVADACAGKILCYGGTTTVNVSAKGGTAPYTGTGSFTVTAGCYRYTITDANGCTASASVTITQPAALSSISVSTKVTGFKCTDGTITVRACEGTAPYTYSDGGAFQTSNVFANLAVGTYSITVKDAHCCIITTTVIVEMAVCGGTTVTQGGYGAPVGGNNWGMYLQNHWSQIGSVTVGEGSKTITLTSSLAIHNFLPSGGTPRALDKSYINPTQKGTTAYKNTLVGQTVTLYLNIQFFGSISTLVINSGSFAGTTVSDMLDIANAVLGGSTAYSASAVNDALSSINENYDGGTDHGFLSCPCKSTITRDNASVASNNTEEESSTVLIHTYPNPFVDKVNFEFTVNSSTYANFQIYSLTGEKVQTLFDGTAEEKTLYKVEFVPINPGMYIYRLSTNEGVATGKVMQAK
jgi:hypothetical protein